MKEKMQKIKLYLENCKYRLLHPKGKRVFLNSLSKNSCLLDVGCGNHSPEITKTLRPDLYYVGIDIDDYNTDEVSKSAANRYIIIEKEQFASAISGLDLQFDAAISSHNLEHCNHPMETLDAICGRLKVGGRLYLSFPCEKSVLFPSKYGTLNFYDDDSHIYLPILKDVMRRLVQKNRMFVDFVAESYKPLLSWCIGAFCDHFFNKQSNYHHTWEHYGFETVIWAHKKEECSQ